MTKHDTLLRQAFRLNKSQLYYELGITPVACGSSYPLKCTRSWSKTQLASEWVRRQS